MFPPDNWWNLDISSGPVDPGSNPSSLSSTAVERNCTLTSEETFPGSVETYGMPYIVVNGDQPRKVVQFYYSDESDGVNHTTGPSFPFYPIPMKRRPNLVTSREGSRAMSTCAIKPTGTC